jgi:hypothetical protein
MQANSGKFKTRSPSALILPAIRELSSSKLRNEVRGIVAKYQRTDLLTADIEKLRSSNNLKDMRLAGRILNGPGGLLRSRPDGNQAIDVYRLKPLRERDVASEIHYASGILNSWPELGAVDVHLM